MVQASYFHLVGLQDTALDEQGERLQRVAFVQQFVAGQLPTLALVPARERQEVDKCLELFGRSLQHIECYMECFLVTVRRRGADIRLGLGAIAILGFQSGGKGCFVDLTDGRHIVVGNPLPQPVLPGKQYRLCVDDL